MSPVSSRIELALEKAIFRETTDQPRSRILARGGGRVLLEQPTGRWFRPTRWVTLEVDRQTLELIRTVTTRRRPI